MSLRASHRSALLVGLSIACAAACASSTLAAQITWNGASNPASTNWSNGGNWVGGIAPQPGVDSIVFDGNAVTTNVNDFAAGSQINGITWNNTGTTSWTHTPTATGGNSINLAGDLVYARTATTLSATLGTSALLQPIALVQNINIDVASGGTLNRFGVTSGAFAITKTGGGLYVSNSADTFSGGLKVTGGTYRTGVSGNTNAIIGSGTVTIDGGTLELRSTTATTFNSDLNLGTTGGNIDIRSNHTFNPASIAGSGVLSLRATGADNLVMSTSDMKGGTGQWNGTVRIDKNGRANFGLRMSSTFATGSMLNIALELGDATSLSRNANTNQTTSVTDIGSLASAFATSSVGATTTGSGTGYFTFSIGALNTSTTFAGNMIDGGTRAALRKVGSGTLTLSGPANTFSGPSAVNAGTLNVTGALTASALALAVNSGGTLAANGSIAGSVTVNSGGTLGGSGSIAGTVNSVGGTIAPGTSPGTLIVGGLSLNSASILNYELNGGNTTVGGSINDLINVTTAGGLTLNGTLNVSETVAGSFASSAGGTWRLINYTGALAGSGLTLGSIPTLPSGASFSIDTATAGQVNLVLTVPEPTSLLVLGAAGLIAMKRRR